MEYNDIELTQMVCENNEDAKDFLYEKYHYIIDIIISKYKKTIYALGMDINEVKQEAMLGFTDALIKYTDSKETSLPTFISIVVERKIQNAVRKAETQKNKIHNEAYSLEYDYETFNRPLEEIIGDSTKDPLRKLESEENYKELTKKINESLSPFEKEVYDLIINDFNYIDIAKILNKEPKQIDNTIQRIRNKIKDLI
jgi:RNA polymerase sporulation-specific sigma factor